MQQNILFIKNKKIFDKKNISYEISKIEGLDINDKIDFMIAESNN